MAWLFSSKKSQKKSSTNQNRAVDIDALLTDTDAALKAFAGSVQSGEELLQALGVSRSVAVKAALVDSEVESCREDLRAAMNQSAWRLYGEEADDAHIDRLWKIVKKHLPTLTEIVLSAKLGGYAVAEYIYHKEEDGFLSIAQIRNKSIDSYSVNYAGELIKQGDNGEEKLERDLKYLLLINNPSDDEPAGDLTVARLFPALMLRQHGARYAMQFIRRYAQPYIVGKTAADKTDFASRLFTFANGGAMAIDHDDELSLLKIDGNGDAFLNLERLANAQIQKLLLGRVKTGDLQNGSRSAQETEEDTRIERINAYLSLLGNAVTHLINAVVEVNKHWGLPITAPNGLFFEFEKEIKVDLERANRDAIYINAGVFKPTKEYITDILGIEEQHFSMSNEQLEMSNGQLSRRVGNSPATRQSRLPEWLLSQGFGTLSVDSDDEDEITPTEQALIYPFLVKVFDAMAKAQTAQEFQAALTAMDFSDEEKTVINLHLPDLVRAYIQAA
ncbi:MAG: DUF935 family protein [Neisseriaceae bacterium]|nr:DUF935 family protein [Neisseriaceae bacterium]